MANVIGWKAASQVSGKSPTHLRRLHADGQLQGEQDDQGRWVFGREALLALRDSGGAPGGAPGGGNGSRATPQPPTARRTPLANEVEHELYVALDRGERLEQVVLDLQLDPGWARQKAASWQRLSGGAAVGERIDDLAAEVSALRQRLRKVEDQLHYVVSEHQVAVVMLEGALRRMG